MAAPDAARSECVPGILVIDDRRDVAEAIADLCRGYGLHAVTSGEGQPARDLLREHRPAGVILDVIMPVEDGYEALKEIAAFDRAMPVLLISGHGETWLRMGEALGRAHRMTNVQSCRKPIRHAALSAFIERVQANRLPAR